MTKNNIIKIKNVIPTLSKNEGQDQSLRRSRFIHTSRCFIHKNYNFPIQTCFSLTFFRSYFFYSNSKKFIREYYLERLTVNKLIKRIKSQDKDLCNFKLLKSLPPIKNPNEFLVSYDNLEQLAYLLINIKRKNMDKCN